MRPPWNFGESRHISLSLDEFLAQQETDGVKFFDGKEPWIEGINKLTWKTFFRVCTEEMDDLSVKATKIVIEYCLEILEEAEAKIHGKPSLARLEAAQRIAGHADSRTTKLYDRRGQKVLLEDMERIRY
jgi:hypothetical protein